MPEPYIRTFVEERELTVYLLVDISPSLEWGSGRLTKRELATEVAATLAFSALRNNDKTGLILFSRDVELVVPAARGRAHVLRLLREIRTARRDRGSPARRSRWMPCARRCPSAALPS